MRIIHRLRGRAPVAAAAVALVGLSTVLTACGSSAPAASACPLPAPGVTAGTIKVGYVYPDTGPAEIASTFKSARSGVEARIDLQNAHGGVNGRRIDLVWRDDQSDEQAFSGAAHELVDTEKVFGLITTSTALDQSAGWLARENVPVAGTASSAIWSDYPNLFHAGNLYNGGGTSVFGDFVRAEGGTRALVIVDPNAAASQGLAAQLTPSLRSRGIQVVGEVTYTDGVTNAARVADQLRKSGADTLVGAAQLEPFLAVYSAAKALGVRFNVALNLTGYSPDLLAQRGADMAGMSIPSSIGAPGSPAMDTYLAAMSDYAPEAKDPADELAIGGYVVADEMIKGLELAGTCPSRQAFIRNLRNVTDFTAGGLISPLDLSHPKQPTLCQTFIDVDKTGTRFVSVPPPTTLDHDGYWCGTSLR
ncbi:ABC transporter substrate-binding protein [Pseudofrankia inefficax]|uniref:Leucine-binding protein domain-containing protein n=1 Tax=Pseudofrankia inefficax (strain DSM 45817 / CECT 9037 / DDB 130130 / EuI1c) TaxID=298654 RepID=E3IWK5_PSEI1|nr:ABC transporter substrate-binding protein [Pseudofrankia inefficax]ADP81335.1 hypothetical protein FraEuI1c_3324 [Pseudofrankia inefficax]